MKSHTGWMVLIALIFGVVGGVFFVLWGLPAYLLWLLTGLPIGYFIGRIIKRRHRLERLMAWRATHPHLSDHWLPRDLKEKA